ncbi:hypothetical protein [Candidatus Chlorohelix allophototropha]
MNKLRTRPDLVIALCITILAIIFALIMLVTYMPGLPYIKNY